MYTHPITILNYPSTMGGMASPPSTSHPRHSPDYGSPSPGEQLSQTNLYIRGLGPETTDKDLIQLCCKFGTIISTKAILDKTTNKCKGYGFVDFESPAAAEKAVRQLQSINLQAQMAKQQEQDPTNLYLANLPPAMNECELEALLRQHANVISTRILRDALTTSRGVGFARLESKEMCEKVIRLFNKKVLAGSKEPLLVKFADYGNKKKTQQYREREGVVWGGREMGTLYPDPSTAALMAAAVASPQVAAYRQQYLAGSAVSPPAPAYHVPPQFYYPATAPHPVPMDVAASQAAAMMGSSLDSSGMPYHPCMPITTHLSHMHLQQQSSGYHVASPPYGSPYVVEDPHSNPEEYTYVPSVVSQHK